MPDTVRQLLINKSKKKLRLRDIFFYILVTRKQNYRGSADWGRIRVSNICMQEQFAYTDWIFIKN